MELIVGLDVGLDVALDVGRFGGDLVTVGGHQGGKTAKNGLGSNSSGVSANHNHGDSGHAHNLTVPDQGASVNFGANYSVGGPASRVTSTAYANIGNQSADHSHTINTTGDNETRPVNRGVKYIIKV